MFLFIQMWLRNFCALGFMGSAVLHVLLLFNVTIPSRIIITLPLVLIISILIAVVLADVNPRISHLHARSPLGFHRYEPEYQDEAIKLWFEYFPSWAKMCFGLITIYLLLQVILLSQINSNELRNFFVVSCLRLLTAFIAAGYWLSIWFWHTQVVRLEKSLGDATIPH